MEGKEANEDDGGRAVKGGVFLLKGKEEKG